MGTHYRGSATEVRALNAYINLLRAADSVSSRLLSGLPALGLTPSRFGVLETLLHLGPLCQRELGGKLLKSGADMTLVVDNLAKKGWVTRERGIKDRRFMSVHLTPKGRALIARIFSGHAKAVAAEFSALTSAEQDSLRALCRKLGRRNIG